MMFKEVFRYVGTVIFAFVTTPILYLLLAGITNSSPMLNLAIKNIHLYNVTSDLLVAVIPVLGVLLLLITVFKRNTTGMVYSGAYLLSIIVYLFLLHSIRINM